MATADVERELVELERQYWDAIKDKNVEVASRLTDDTCILTGAQGVGRLDRTSLADMIKCASYDLLEFEVSDPQVRLIQDDVAIVAYKVREKLRVDGTSVTLDAADASTWVRRDGRWVCALHTEALAGDPFGRDRRAAG